MPLHGTPIVWVQKLCQNGAVGETPAARRPSVTRAQVLAASPLAAALVGAQQAPGPPDLAALDCPLLATMAQALDEQDATWTRESD